MVKTEAVSVLFEKTGDTVMDRLDESVDVEEPTEIEVLYDPVSAIKPAALEETVPAGGEAEGAAAEEVEAAAAL